MNKRNISFGCNLLTNKETGGSDNGNKHKQTKKMKAVRV